MQNARLSPNISRIQRLKQCSHGASAPTIGFECECVLTKNQNQSCVLTSPALLAKPLRPYETRYKSHYNLEPFRGLKKTPKGNHQALALKGERHLTCSQGLNPGRSGRGASVATTPPSLNTRQDKNIIRNGWYGYQWKCSHKTSWK